MSWPSKDPNEKDARYIVWCDEDGTNDGSATDDGELQGATISTATWTVPSGITKESSNQNAFDMKGISYSANTVATIWLSGGTDGEDYDCLCHITTSDGRTLDKTETLRVRSR